MTAPYKALLFLLSLVSTNAFTGTEIITTNDFAEVSRKVSGLNKKHTPKNVLIVLDIDNTILTSSTDLGGDIWYQWQRGKLQTKPTESQKVECLFEDVIGLLYELNPMNLTDKTLPGLISGWQSSGNTLMALTSRAPRYRAATERELGIENINFSKAALAQEGGAVPVYREKLEREMSYINGIMMTTGMNKGVMLEHILKKTKRAFDAIVFVDDSKKNINAMSDRFKGANDMDVAIFHYTKIETDRIERHGSVLTKRQALEIDEKWKELKATLSRIFPERKIPNGCLSKN